MLVEFFCLCTFFFFSKGLTVKVFWSWPFCLLICGCAVSLLLLTQLRSQCCSAPAACQKGSEEETPSMPKDRPSQWTVSIYSSPTLRIKMTCVERCCFVFFYLCMLSAGNWTWIIYLACNENGDMEGCSSTVKLCPCMNINETSLFPLSQEATPSGSGSCSSQDTDISLPGALSSSNAASAKRNDTNTFTKYHHW